MSYLKALIRKGFQNKSAVTLISSNPILSEPVFNFNKLRLFTTQNVAEESNDLPNNDQLVNNLRNHFYQIDSSLKRNNLIRGNSIKKLTADVKRTAHRGGNITPQQVLFLLKCCGMYVSGENRQTNIEMVTDIWNMCQEQELSLDISHYNALLELYLENEHKFSPSDFLELFKQKGIQPNQITYSRLLAQYCQVGDIEGATKILQSMKEEGMPVTEYVFNYLIIGNARARDLEGAQNILEIMRGNECPPTGKTYVVLAGAFVESGDLDRAQEVLVEGQEEDEGLLLSTRPLLDLLCKVLSQEGGQEHPIVQWIVDKLSIHEGDKPTLEGTLIRMLVEGHDKVVSKILPSCVRERRSHQLGHVLRGVGFLHLPLESVARLCDEMRSLGVNVLAYEVVLESYLLQERCDDALGLMRHMKEKGVILKEHYFYPLLCHFKKNGREKVMSVLEEMEALGMKMPTENFFSFFLLPVMINGEDGVGPEKIYLELIEDHRIQVDRAYNAVVAYLLYKKDLEATIQFVRRFRRGIRQSLSGLIASSFLVGRDSSSIAILLHHLLPLTLRRSRQPTWEAIPDASFIGIRDFLFLVIKGLKHRDTFHECFIDLLKAMETEGVGFPAFLVDPLTSFIGKEAMTEEIDRLFATLTDHDFIVKGAREVMSVDELRDQIAEVEKEGEGAQDLKMRLLCTLMQENKLEEVVDLITKLKCDPDVVIVPEVLVSALDFFIEAELLSEAQGVFHHILNNYPEFCIHAHKVLKYAELLNRNGQTQDACTALQMAAPEDGMWSKQVAPDFTKGVSRQRITALLSLLVAQKDFASLQLMQEVLLSQGYASPDLVLPSLIKYHLEDGNLAEAIATYTKLAADHNTAFCNNEVLKAVLTAGDKDLLEQVLEVNRRIYGSANTTYSVAFAYISLGKLAEAEKTFRTPGLPLMQNRLSKYCQLLMSQGRITELDLLVKTTRCLPNLDRPPLYDMLLKGTMTLHDPQRALGLWLLMQEENAIPSDWFLLTLSQFLQANGVEVPFVVPQVVSQPLQDHRESRATSAWPPAHSPLLQELCKAMESPELAPVQEAWARVKDSDERKDQSVWFRVVSYLLDSGYVEEALGETLSFLATGAVPPRTATNRILSALASKGDIHNIQRFNQYVDKDLQRSFKYHYFLGLAHLNAGKGEEYLSAALASIQDSNLSTEEHGITNGVIKEVLTSRPHLVPLLEECAGAQAARGDPLFYSSFFDINFALGNLQKAQEIYDNHLTEAEELEVRDVCRQSWLQKDVSKLKDLLEVVERRQGRNHTKGVIYSTYIDILNTLGNSEEALRVVKSSLETIQLTHYRPLTLSMMRKQFEKKGLAFPYQLPLAEKVSSPGGAANPDGEK